MVVHSDSDFAGCSATRRSTSGGVVMVGLHCVKHWSSTQPTVSLASAESELHGVAKAGANALGIQAVAKGLAIDLEFSILTDASAAIGIVKRRGLRQIRHLATTDLWLQERNRDKGFTVSKVLGVENLADILTKPVDRAALIKHLDAMNCHPETGKAATAPELIQQPLEILDVPAGRYILSEE